MVLPVCPPRTFRYQPLTVSAQRLSLALPASQKYKRKTSPAHPSPPTMTDSPSLPSFGGVPLRVCSTLPPVFPSRIHPLSPSSRLSWCGNCMTTPPFLVAFPPPHFLPPLLVFCPPPRQATCFLLVVLGSASVGRGKAEGISCPE